MADEVAAPAAPAAAPAGTPEGTQQNAPPVDPLAEHLAAIDKAGGIEVKVNGKNVKMTTEQLRRYAQKNAPIDSAMQELQKKRSELDPKIALLEKLENGSDDERTDAIEKLLGSKFISVAEKRLLRELESQKKYEGMSPREREMAQQIESLTGEKQTEAQKRAELERVQAEAEESREVNQQLQVLTKVTMDALNTLDLPPKMEPLAMKLMRPIMHELMANGQTPSGEELAKHVEETIEALVDWSFKGPRSEKSLKRHRAALRQYADVQYAAINRPQGGTPPASQNPQKREEPKPGNGKFDPRVRQW